MHKTAILQSSYLPWKGVFDIINAVDTFVFLEDVEYTKRDWRNRNKVLTNDGAKWITVPVRTKGRHNQLIYEAEIDETQKWQKKHLKTFQMNYSNAPYFEDYKWIIEDLYLKKQWDKISNLNRYFTKLIANILEIDVEFINSVDLNTDGQKDDKLIEICNKIDADYYLSGPVAKNYINPKKFKTNNIILDYIKYEYPRYEQVYNLFEHQVTILDLIFNCGQNADYYIWGWREDKKFNEKVDRL